MNELKLIIRQDRTLAEIKEDFSREYPYLKLEFFRVLHHEGQGSPLKDLFPDHLKVAQCRTKVNEGMIHVTPALTVADLEDFLADIYGLSAQVFRRSGEQWLETIVTDNWTLEEQNRRGEEYAELTLRNPGVSPEEFWDYD